jgi:DNA uptake protein ComE-like DNA-binding protein
MKPSSFEPFRNWFGYNRRERRASFILILLIVTVISVRYMIPQPSQAPEVTTLSAMLPETDSAMSGNIAYGTRKPVRKKMQAKSRKVLELNSCDSASLEGLPGIGPVLARRIIKYRNLLGGFASASQLREVYGLQDSTFNIISGRVKADSSKIEKINLNSADFKRLIRLPYFEKYDVTAILKYRELHGMVENLDELVKNKVLTPEKAGKVRVYMEFGK